MRPTMAKVFRRRKYHVRWYWAHRARRLRRNSDVGGASVCAATVSVPPIPPVIRVAPSGPGRRIKCQR